MNKKLLVIVFIFVVQSQAAFAMIHGHCTQGRSALKWAREQIEEIDACMIDSIEKNRKTSSKTDLSESSWKYISAAMRLQNIVVLHHGYKAEVIFQKRKDTCALSPFCVHQIPNNSPVTTSSDVSSVPGSPRKFSAPSNSPMTTSLEVSSVSNSPCKSHASTPRSPKLELIDSCPERKVCIDTFNKIAVFVSKKEKTVVLPGLKEIMDRHK